MTQLHYKSFIKDNSIVIGGHLLLYIKGIILMPIIIKNVGVTTYGGFILLTSIFGIVFGISTFGTGFMARRLLPATKGMAERSQLFYPQFFFQTFSLLILSLLLVLLEKQLNTYLFKNQISFSIWIIPLYFVIFLLFAQGADYFRFTSRVQYMTLSTLIFPYLHLGLIIFYINCYGPISINILVISTTLAALLIAIPSWGVIFKELGTKFSFYTARNLVLDIKIGFPLLSNYILDFILSGSDRYLIAFYLSLAAVGNYTPGYALGSLIVFIPKAMGTALPQLLYRAVDNGKEIEARMMLNYSIKFFLLLAIPFIVGCLALGKPILTLLANKDVAEKAYWVAPLVALGTIFYGLNLILSNVLFVRMKTHSIFKINALAAIFSLLANFIFLYFFRSIIIASITLLLSYVIAFLYLIKIIKNEWLIDFDWVTISKSILAALVMGGLILWVKEIFHGSNNIRLLFGQIILGTFVYAIALFSLKTFSKKEISFIKRIFIKG